MKVELDLSTEQLQELDKGLMNLITSLTDEQKIDIVKEYLKNKMDDNFYIKDEWGHQKSLSNFGREVINGLQSKVAKNITEDLFRDKETIKRIDNVAEMVRKNIGTIVTESLVKYTTQQLFRSQDEVMAQILCQTNDLINQRLNYYR